MISLIKDCILDIIASVGVVAKNVRAVSYADQQSADLERRHKTIIRDCAADILKACLKICEVLDVSFEDAVDKKMVINSHKYDKHMSKGPDTIHKKWTELSTMSGVFDLPGLMRSVGSLPKPKTDKLANIDLHTMTVCAYSFVKDREWECHDTPRSLMLALAGEVGELTELYQWTDYKHDGVLSDSRRIDTILEVADITIYLLRICRLYNINPEDLKNDAI